MEDLKKIRIEMESMKKRLAVYESNYENKSKNPRSDAASKICVTGVSKNDEQKNELNGMKEALLKLQQMIDSTMKRLSAVERRQDDLEQYSRSNCLVIHGCENVPKSKPGKYLEIENFVCNTLNEHLQLDSPLQANDLDIAHPLPSKKGTPVIVKFIRRSQKNEVQVYRKKRLLKGTKMIITESLTKRRLQLLEKARLEFKQCPVWSWKGEIFVFHNNKKKVIDDFIDITKIKSELSYAQTVKQ